MTQILTVISFLAINIFLTAAVKDFVPYLSFLPSNTIKKILPAIPLVIGSLLYYFFGVIGVPITPDSIKEALLQIDKIVGISPNELNAIIGGFMGALASSVFDFFKALMK